MKIEAEFDLDKLRKQIEAAKDIKGDEPFFEQLAQVQAVKRQLAEVEDLLMSIELEAKGLINNKAKALYGDNWQVIKGENFKIMRSKTGDMYVLAGKANPKFVKVKQSVDSKAVDEYVAAHSKLPTGIEINDHRGETIRITLK